MIRPFGDRETVRFALCCVIVGLLSGCVRPRPAPDRSTEIDRSATDLIVSGSVSRVSDSRLSTILVDPNIWRQQVCLNVDHVLKGPVAREICFVQFTGDYSHSGKRPLPALSPGKNILMFLNDDSGVWRPPVDFVRVWMDLACGAICGLPLSESTLNGQMIELLLRFDVSEEYPVESDIVSVFVRKALQFGDRQAVKARLKQMLAVKSPPVKAAICAELINVFGDGECRDHETK
jgi:hypothetical protein